MGAKRGLLPVEKKHKYVHRVRARVRVTLGLEVFLQSVRLGAKPLETHDQYFFSTEHLVLMKHPL
jgi:hypothetical protein